MGLRNTDAEVGRRKGLCTRLKINRQFEPDQLRHNAHSHPTQNIAAGVRLLYLLSIARRHLRMLLTTRLSRKEKQRGAHDGLSLRSEDPSRHCKY